MLLTLYDQYGIVKTTLSPNDTSTQDKEIQGDNVLSLSFTLYEYVSIDVNDYVVFEGEHYWAVEKYLPQEKSTVEWEYNVKLYGIESLIKRFLVLKTADGDNEAVFTLTAKPSEHIDLIVQNINDGMGNTTNFKKGTVEGTENVVIEYAGKYCDEALKELAEAVGVEWWIEGETVNLCRCEHGEEVTLGYGNGLTSIDRDVADNAKFFTRLFPIGSSRNIDPERYGSNRLQLPNGVKYVDVNTERYGIIHHYEQEAFSGIYPHREGVVSDVREKTVTDNDGKPFKIYYFKDNDLPLIFDPNDYEIGGLVKHVSFVTGELAGLGADDDHYFEVNYDSRTNEFEIITIWPYDNDIQLPGGSLIPKRGDKYILWNIRMPDEYYGLAEEAYYKKVNEYIAQHALDVSRYKAPTDHVWIENEGVNLFVGCRIRLESLEYFPDTGYRSSRITRISRQVTLPSQMDLEISDALSTKTLDKIDDNIRDVKNYTGSLVGRMSLPDIIRSWDTTHPTDNNLYSARRSHREFLSKNNADRAKEKIIFEKGIELGDYETGEQGGNIDGQGNAELLNVVVRQLLRSARFVDGFGGEGWQLWIDENQLANLTIDKLTVRQIMTVFELLVEKIRSVGGQIVVSAANGKIKTVEEVGDYYKITFEQENTFVAHDLMRCQTFTGGNLKSYWVEVTSVDGNSILIAKSEFEASLPAEADECVLMGNTTNTMRQNLILISATEDGQPRIDVMDGVKAKNLECCLRARLGKLDGISDTWFPVDNQPQGNGLYSDNVYLRGTFFLVDENMDVKTKFEVTEGKIQSSVSALRQDFAQANGYLNNPCFDEGLSKWFTENDTVFWQVGNRWIWANKNVLTKKGDGASVTIDDGRVVVRIKNKYITQRNGNLRTIPTMETNAGTGKKEAKPVYLSFFYRCATQGTLRIRFENVDKTGFEDFNSFDVEETLAVTTGYKQYTCDGLWNGTGDFKLSFTGDIYLYMLILSTDKVESLAYRYRSLFKQSAKLTHLAQQYLDADGNILASSGIMIKANGSGIYCQDANGNLALIGVGRQVDDGNGGTRMVIKLTADNIELEGLVTANQNFRIKADGSMEAKNGTFDGYLRTKIKPLLQSDAEYGSVIYPQNGGAYILNNDLNIQVDYNDVALPVSEEYIGSRVILWNSKRPPYTRAGLEMVSSVVCVDGSPIMGVTGEATTAEELLNWSDPVKICWLNGMMELVGVPVIADSVYDPNTGTYTDTYKCGWCIIAFNALYRYFYHNNN